MTVIAINKEYKTSEAHRKAAIENYKSKRGSAYKSQAERRRERAVANCRKASDQLARDVAAAAEIAFGFRECSSCQETLPMDVIHFYPMAASRNGLTVRCQACHNGYSSWSSQSAEKAVRKAKRDTEREARARAKAEIKALKQAQRDRVAAVKGSDQWKSAMKTKYKALEMMSLYSELAAISWSAWDFDWSTEEFGEALQEVAFKHNREHFLELNSPGYVAAVEGSFPQADPYEMGRTWEELRGNWRRKWIEATETLEKLTASLIEPLGESATQSI